MTYQILLALAVVVALVWLVRRFSVVQATKAQEALRLSEAKFAGIVAIASDAIISIDESHRIINFNQGAELTFGYTAAEMVGLEMDVLLPERYRPGHRAHVEHFARGPVTARRMGERQEISGLRKNGEEFPAEASISKLEVAGARVLTVLLRDTTNTKRAAQRDQFLSRTSAALARSLDFEETVETIARMPIPAYADACVICEVGEQHQISAIYAAHVDAEKEARIRRMLYQPLSAGPEFEIALTGQPLLVRSLDDVTVHEGESSLVPVLREVGLVTAVLAPIAVRDRISGCIGLFRGSGAREYDADDAAFLQELALRAGMALENARLYRRAQDAVAARDDVLAVVSHDLGNPLSAIRIGTSLLLKQLPPEEQRSGGWQHLDAIRQSVGQMERLITDLLDVKRIEAGQLSLERHAESVPSLLQEVFETMRPLTLGRALRIEVQVEGELPLIEIDRSRIVQVFSNLIGNAVKYAADADLISVRARRDGDRVRFEVSDNGPGMVPEELPHIFERFWRARGTGRIGSGLGLAISKSIVEAHGGQIYAESAPGEGMSVTFLLPITAPSSAAS